MLSKRRTPARWKITKPEIDPCCLDILHSIGSTLSSYYQNLLIIYSTIICLYIFFTIKKTYKQQYCFIQINKDICGTKSILVRYLALKKNNRLTTKTFLKEIIKFIRSYSFDYNTYILVYLIIPKYLSLLSIWS